MRYSLRKMRNENEGERGAWQMALLFALIMCVLAGLLFFALGALRGSKETADSTVLTGVEKPVSMRAMQAGVNAKLPSAEAEMVVPAQAFIVGKWFTKFKESAIVEVTFTDGGLYELIYTNDPQGRLREYSRGQYLYKEDSGVIKLYPYPSMGEPSEIPGVVYENMTSRNYEILLRQQGRSGRSLYLMALDSQRVARRFHPIFSYADFTGAPVLQFERLIPQGQ